MSHNDEANHFPPTTLGRLQRAAYAARCVHQAVVALDRHKPTPMQPAEEKRLRQVRALALCELRLALDELEKHEDIH